MRYNRLIREACVPRPFLRRPRVLLFFFLLAAAPCERARPGETALSPAEEQKLLKIIGEDPSRQESPRKETPVWTETDISLAAGAGYKDNVLLSARDGEKSWFWQAEAEFFLMRLSERGIEYNLFALAEHTQYFELEKNRDEQFFLLHAGARQLMGSPLTAGIQGEYYYLNQVFGTAELDGLPSPSQVRQHHAGLAAAVSREFGGGHEAEVKAGAGRDLYEKGANGFNKDGDEDYYEFEARARWSKTCGPGSSLRASFTWTGRYYNRREQRDRNGLPVPGTLLRARYYEGQARWKHSWKAGWKNDIRLGWKRKTDGASGYYDYDRWEARHGLEWKGKTWRCEAGWRLAYYDYRIRPVTWGGSRTRHRASLAWDLRLEYEPASSWRVFARFEHEKNLSNYAPDEYAVKTATIGTARSF